MLTYKNLLVKNVWKVRDIKNSIIESKYVVSIAGSLLREKIIQNEDPLRWTLDIDLLCELYSTIMQVFHLFNEITNNDYDDDKREIKISYNQKVVLKAFSENIELCQEELKSGFSLKFDKPMVLNE